MKITLLGRFWIRPSLTPLYLRRPLPTWEELEKALEALIQEFYSGATFRVIDFDRYAACEPCHKTGKKWNCTHVNYLKQPLEKYVWKPPCKGCASKNALCDRCKDKALEQILQDLNRPKATLQFYDR